MQTGSLVLVTGDVGTPSGSPRDCPFCGRIGRWGVGEMLLDTIHAEGGFDEAPHLASEWALAPDASYTDFKIRTGVEFHDGWGELTAADVAWTYNESNPSVTTESTHDQGGELLTFLADGVPAEVVNGGDTVRIFWKSYSITTTYPKTVTPFFQAIPVFSKKVFEDKGSDWMRENVIGTGPFKMVTWVQADRFVTEAIPKHWFKTASIAKVTALEIPEPSTRRAMLETGEAQIAAVSSTDEIVLLRDPKFKKAPEGATLGYGIVTGGNYLETVHPTSGEPMQREVPDLPWVDKIGDPVGTANALKVRWALSMAIDREGLAEGLFQGAAQIQYLGGVDSKDPLYQARIDKYTIPYDPDGAKELMTEAGYPDGFKAGFYFREAGADRDRIGQAVCAGWKQDLGVECAGDNSPYATYRPKYINRTSFDFSFRSGGSKEPITWSNEWYASGSSSTPDGTAGGGFNSGFELEFASDVLKMKSAAGSMKELEDIAVQWMDYLYDTQYWIGTVDVVQAPLYNSEEICEWDMFPISSSSEQNLETVVFCK